MGVSLVKKSENTEVPYKYDFSYAGFARFRCLVAKTHNPEWGIAYEQSDAAGTGIEDGTKLGQLTKKLEEEGKLNHAIVEFCTKPKSYGQLNHDDVSALTEVVSRLSGNYQFVLPFDSNGCDVDDIKNFFEVLSKSGSDAFWCQEYC